MRDRIELSERLHKIRDNVYFQPDENTRMKFPCIEYSFDGEAINKADNHEYVGHARYSIIDIYKSPSSKKYKEIKEAFLFISFSNQYIADGLYHDVYTLYF